MENNHLTYFKIENFKKFESLEVNDIGQFNLIVGDNNVGKTCLLEALLFDLRPKNTISWYHELLVKRRLVSGLFLLLNETNDEKNFESNTFAQYQRDIKKEIKFTINGDVYSLENKNEEISKTTNQEILRFIKEEGLFDYDGINKKSKNWIVFKINSKTRFLLDLTSSYYEDFINRPQNSKIPNIPALMLNDDIESYLGKHYDKIFIELDLGEKVARLVTVLFSNIEITEFQKQNEVSALFFYSLKIKTKERNQFHNIREYGDGFVRCLSMIIQLLSGNSSKIIIDEIDTGIHHTKLDIVWKTVLLICKEFDIQLFATTHSQECIESYLQASKELNEKDIRLIRLQENKDKSIKAICYKEEYIEYMVESNTEER